LLLSLLVGAVFAIAAYAVLILSLTQLPQIMRLDNSRIFAIALGVPYLLTGHIAVGQCIARVSRRPLAAWVSAGVFCTLVWTVLAFATRSLPAYPYPSLLLVLLGAIWERRRSLYALTRVRHGFRLPTP
jgi:hypothetical protein